jgi:hypothetical protein
MKDETSFANMALTFLARATITGNEVEQYIVVRKWLTDKTKPAPTMPPETMKDVLAPTTGPIANRATRRKAAKTTKTTKPVKK